MCVCRASEASLGFGDFGYKPGLSFLEVKNYDKFLQLVFEKITTSFCSWFSRYLNFNKWQDKEV